jgi:hypothetical protein
MLSAICRICFLPWRRGFAGSGLSWSIAWQTIDVRGFRFPLAQAYRLRKLPLAGRPLEMSPAQRRRLRGPATTEIQLLPQHPPVSLAAHAATLRDGVGHEMATS